MKFSTTTEYALRIVSYMALDESKLYRADDVIEDLQIPQRYLRKLLTKLTKNGILKSIQGKKGGYLIAGDINEISLLDIVEASGEQVGMKDCFFGLRKCDFHSNCTLHNKWSDISQQIVDTLASTKLSDVKKSKPLFLVKNFDKVDNI